MPKTEVHNETSQAERRKVAENDRRVRTSTFSAFAEAEIDQPRGRFDAIDRPSVTGASPIPQYPPQTPSSPWANRMPDELPLGVAIDEMPPTGEVFEVEKSLREARGGAGSSPPGAAELPSPGERRSAGFPHPALRRARRFSLKRKRR